MKLEMKKYISTLTVGILLMAFGSCSKDTEGLTGVTYYPVIELDGPINDLIEAGVPYVEPGYSAKLDGEDYTSHVEIFTDMDFNDPQPGYYPIIYSAVNADGFSRTVARYVIVAENDDPMSGFYTTNTDSYRDYGGIIYYGGFPVAVYSNGDNTYHVSDLLGGWYEYRAGYGSDYALEGDIDIDANGNITLIDSYVYGFDMTADDLSAGKFDKDAGTIKYLITFADMPFNITLDKN